MASKKKEKSEEDQHIELHVIHNITAITAPKTSQDAVDKLAAEFITANLIRMHAERRYDAIKKRINEDYEGRIAALRSSATLAMTKTSETLAGADWCLTFSANKPATRVDVDELRTELVRRGIKVDLIDAAIGKVSKPATPALVISATKMG